MKLLILTQTVDENNPILGFFIDWVKEFSKHCESIIIICLYEGKYNLPANVKVFSLGKESGISRIKYLFRFYKYIWQERKNYDFVFVHMNQVYVILGGLLWRLWRKKIGLWYVHRQVNQQLIIAEKIVDSIFTTSEESFGVKSKKVKILGHGINVNKFSPAEIKNVSELYNIIYVGRITEIKNLLLLVEAINVLVNRKLFKDLRIKLIGGTVFPKDESYKNELIALINKYGLDSYVEFVGNVPNKQMVSFYQQADLSVNLSPTGGMDKSVLESMAVGVPVIVLNQAFKSEFADYGDELLLSKEDAEELVDKVINLKGMDKNRLLDLKNKLVFRVKNNHNLENLIKIICRELMYGKTSQ